MSGTGRALVFATAAGVAAFLVVGVAVTAIAETWIEFSLFVGLPAGLGAGAVTAAAVYLGLADDASAPRRRTAATVSGFGVGFLAAFAALAALGGLGVTLALAVSVVVGFVVAVAVSLRDLR